MNEITGAFRKYIMERDDIPSPANIREIILEERKYANVKRPSIEKLIEYQAKGIRLTPDQINQLNQHTNITEAV